MYHLDMQSSRAKSNFRADLADEMTHLRIENRELHRMISGLAERMEFLEDSLDAHLAMQEFERSGEESIPWEEVEAELDASR